MTRDDVRDDPDALGFCCLFCWEPIGSQARWFYAEGVGDDGALAHVECWARAGRPGGWELASWDPFPSSVKG